MTDTSMPPERISRIRELEKSATPGPWHSTQATDADVCRLLTGGDDTPSKLLGRIAPGGDAEFIAAARHAIPELLAEVDRLRGELSDATAEMAENARAMNALRRHRDTAESRLAEEARDKDNHSVDTGLLLDALGLES